MTLYVSAKYKANNEDISGICHKNNIIVGLIFSGMFCMKGTGPGQNHQKIVDFILAS